jgi:hypothetical protein
MAYIHQQSFSSWKYLLTSKPIQDLLVQKYNGLTNKLIQDMLLQKYNGYIYIYILRGLMELSHPISILAIGKYAMLIYLIA